MRGLFLKKSRVLILIGHTMLGNGDGIVDTYSGSLKVHHTDISIPGNGGLDIQVERIYGLNSGSFGTGLGDSSWKLHFGRLLEVGRLLISFVTPLK
jgi:hypothetical protein